MKYGAWLSMLLILSFALDMGAVTPSRMPQSRKLHIRGGHLKVSSVPADITAPRHNFKARRAALQKLTPEDRTFAQTELAKAPETFVTDQMIEQAPSTPASYKEFLTTFKGAPIKPLVQRLK